MSKSESIRGQQLNALRKLSIDAYVDQYGAMVSGAAMKSVLRSIDDHGSKCWASVATIAAETCLNEKTVRRSLRALEARGLVFVTVKIGCTSDYQINWPKVTTLDSMSEVAAETTLDSMSTTLDSMSTTLDSMSTNPGHRVQRSVRKRKGSVKKRNSLSPLRFDDEDLSLANLMLERIKSVAPKTKTTADDLNKWANTIRMMRELDGHTLDEIKAVFTWANTDDFWKAQILSPDNLRKKFASLHARMSNPVTFGKPRTANVGAGVNHDPKKELKW